MLFDEMRLVAMMAMLLVISSKSSSPSENSTSEYVSSYSAPHELAVDMV